MLKEYEITDAYGYSSTYLLTPEQAKRFPNAKPVETAPRAKAARPANKRAVPQNKAR